MTDTRLFAVEALLDVLTEKALLKNAVESRSGLLDRRDRSFLMEIVYGVLRFRDTLDWILRNFLKHPSRLDEFTLNNLRVAVYQLFFMRVPEWAVVNESVELEKNPGAVSGKPDLVNAVLRNLLRRKDSFELPLKIEDELSAIAVNTSHPLWLVKRWAKRFGIEGAALLATANNEIPGLTIRVNTLRITRDDLVRRLSEAGIESEPGSYSPDAISIKTAVRYEDLSFAQGLFLVQDEASQLISYFLDPKSGERVLDACAAPGGKATHIAQLMRDTGEVVAVEKESRRIGRLRENIRALGLGSVKVLNADANRLTEPEAGSFDRILLDAPCSAIGVIRRNPDVKYRRSRRDLREYKAAQVELLQNLSPLVKKDGVLVYSVCSTEPEEGEDAVQEFLKTAGDFRIIDTEDPLLGRFTHGGFLRTYPHTDGMDGFFGAKLRRVE